MDKSLQAYVKVYEDMIPVSLRDTLTTKLKDANWEQHTFYHPSKDVFEPKLGNAELDITVLNYDESVHQLMNITWNVIHKYIKELDFSWFDGWNRFSQVRFNRYVVGRQMDLHCDHIHSLFDGEQKGVPILSIVGALNDDYEGGDFVMFEDSPVRIPAGGYLVFPSSFLYPHRVTEVTKGERNTFVSWAW